MRYGDLTSYRKQGTSKQGAIKKINSSDYMVLL